ncbi:methyl-accepting chemotaxis protein [Halomonas pacifica]|uniref:methyl-accepting chemotaxis protein n=1 Tax=Bisbaumannia pacifica TaxID=77098 RepID=UPI002359BB91|nr:methyl-accepting chemotaxis protein [Halomonas pacifica]MDC8803842.1 methyl-accepting chemotaxis protein [Halomonas pacifica]
MHWFSRLSLTQKLLGALALPLLLACLALGIIVKTQLNASVPTMMAESAERQLTARADEIGQWIDGYRRWLDGLARDERLTDGAPVATRQAWLAERHPGEAGLESFYVADADGDVITHTGTTVNITHRDYFQALVTQGSAERLLVDPVISVVSGQPTAVFAQALVDERGQRVGLLGTTLTMEAVSEITSRISLGEGSYGYLVDSSGTVVAHPDAELRMNLKVTEAESIGFQGANALGREMLGGEAGHGRVTSPEGEAVSLLWQPIPGTDWTLVMAVPERLFTAVSRELLTSLLLAGIVILAVLLAILGVSTRRALAPIRQTAQAMADIAKGKGDLTRRLAVKSQDEVGELAVQFNAFVERMQHTLQQVRGNARQVLDGASDMADGTQELSSRTEQAAANLQETSASMEEIHSTVTHTTQAAEQANGLALTAAGTAEQGSEAMQQVEAKMAAINDSATRISEIIGLIDSIAFQTNILALNASVEAARAGEQGRGFAVVAGEVRNLASRSAEAAQDIRGLIDASVRHTQEGDGLVKDAAERMQAIRQSVTQVADVIAEITAGAREQTTGIEQINTAVAEMDTVTQQNATMVNQNAGLASTMRENAQRLDRLMAEFVLGEDGPALERRPSAPSPALPARPGAPRQDTPEPEWEAF